MEAINLTFIFLIVLGFILIIYALIKMQKIDENKTEIFTIEETIKKLKKHIKNADEVMDEMNALAEQIFLQFQEKRQELIFLYDLIEEKKGEISPNIDISINKEFEKQNLKQQESPLFKKILKMKKGGLSNSEIAKKLDVGKGEVELILNLWKEYSHE